jgi:hypothetical protein
MMLHTFSTLFVEIDWYPLLTPGVGLGAAVMVILAGWLFFRRNRPRQPDAKPAAPAAGNTWDGIERRAHPRRSSGSLAVEIAGPESNAVITTGVILDKALGGLGLEVESEIPTGARFRLRLRDAGPDAGWALLEVRFARKKGTVWRIGCQFVDIAAWDVMEWLGPPDPDE